MFDLWIDADGDLSLCHAECQDGKDGWSRGDRRHLDALKIVATFLEANPHEVITIIYEDYVRQGNLVLNDFEAADLLKYTYVHDDTLPDGAGSTSTGPWPTLQRMIESGERLLVLTDRNYNPEWLAQVAPWLHYNKNVYWETRYDNTQTADFDCELDRGDKGLNKLLVVNHYRNDYWGLPAQSKAARSNDYDMIVRHALICNVTTQPAQYPNFMTFDFWSTGDVVRAVQDINLIKFGLMNTTVDPYDTSDNDWWAELMEEIEASLWLQQLLIAALILMVIFCCCGCNILYIWCSAVEKVKEKALERSKSKILRKFPKAQARYTRYYVWKVDLKLKIWRWLHERHCGVNGGCCCDTILCGCCKYCIGCCCFCNPVFRKKNPDFYTKSFREREVIMTDDGNLRLSSKTSTEQESGAEVGAQVHPPVEMMPPQPKEAFVNEV
ncbi:hypothetical protein CYMTET_48543 [Cymbomonas tetramitiformis]|uniref:PLC-like phosphodiesterase n=1 Tax=Cymbomonas tetramitiformis TaxID=36881 RepID=A0AAE0BS37_9CHLO|nr:hypothetical protein CYMTET_48543 [Cymbomonas tetramitiformis]